MSLFFNLPEKEENRTKGVMFGNLIFSIIFIFFGVYGIYAIVNQFNWVALILTLSILILGIRGFTKFWVLYKYLKERI